MGVGDASYYTIIHEINKIKGKPNGANQKKILKKKTKKKPHLAFTSLT
jgi:hypothetical protein